MDPNRKKHLQEQLQAALSEERYEDAAVIRDQLNGEPLMKVTSEYDLSATPKSEIFSRPFPITYQGHPPPAEPFKWDPEKITPYEAPAELRRVQQEVLERYVKLVNTSLEERMVEIEGYIPSKYEGAQHAFCVQSNSCQGACYEYFWKGKCIMRVSWHTDLYSGTQGPTITKVYDHG